MPEGLAHLFARRAPGQVFTDILDLLIVTYLVYRALLVLRGTRAMQMGTGLGLIFLIYIAAKWLSLVTLLNLLSTLLSSIILIVVVVFQNDIRRGLMRVGSRAFLGGFARAQESRVIDEVVAAATELARHRMGALIAFEQDANLDEFVVAQGIPVDSCVTRELMVSLFVPESVNKLHDGAVIIRNLRIAKAGVFFPMPETRIVDTSLGSRHRAALGITEETDAVVVVVSEERGTISFCFSGNIVSNLDGASLRQALLGLFGRKPRKKGSKRLSTPRTSTAAPMRTTLASPVSQTATPDSVTASASEPASPRSGAKTQASRIATPVATRAAPSRVGTPAPFQATAQPSSASRNATASATPSSIPPSSSRNATPSNPPSSIPPPDDRTATPIKPSSRPPAPASRTASTSAPSSVPPTIGSPAAGAATSSGHTPVRHLAAIRIPTPLPSAASLGKAAGEKRDPGGSTRAEPLAEPPRHDSILPPSPDEPARAPLIAQAEDDDESTDMPASPLPGRRSDLS